VSSVPVLKVGKVDIQPLLEITSNDFVDAAVETIIPVVPTRRRKKANNSVSDPTFYTLDTANGHSDQDAQLAQRVVHH
jgi:hypothetical protein